MNLQEIDGFKILNLIDHATPYTAATINKKQRLNLKSGSSKTGFTILMCGNGKYATIAWKSNKLKRVVESTLSAETLALEEALESIFMIKSLLSELLNKEIKSDLFPVYGCH